MILPTLVVVAVGIFGIALSNAASASSSSAKASNSIYDAACAKKTSAKKSTGKTDSKMPEVSGIAASHKKSGYYWVHNDSKNNAEIYALNSSGKKTATYKIKGATMSDWEDIDVAGGKVYIADTGTNTKKRNPVFIYTFAEPDPTKSGTVTAKKISVKYSDGKVHNTEAMMVDPVGKIYLIDKSKTSITHIWAADGTNTSVVMKQIRPIGYKSGKGYSEITGADMATNGKYFTVRTNKTIYVYKGGAKTTKYCKINNPGGKKGEAIGFTLDGKGLVSISEGEGEPIYKITAKSASSKNSSKDSGGSADDKDEDDSDEDDDDDKKSSSPSPSPGPTANPAPQGAKGDGDCTTTNYRDDQGFRCNPSGADQNTCKGMGGHAILAGDGKPRCIKKGMKCGAGGYSELMPGGKAGSLCLVPDGNPGAPLNSPLKNVANPNNADCHIKSGIDASGFLCGNDAGRIAACAKISPAAHLVTLTNGSPMCVYNDNKRQCPKDNTFTDATFPERGKCRNASSP